MRWHLKSTESSTDVYQEGYWKGNGFSIIWFSDWATFFTLLVKLHFLELCILYQIPVPSVCVRLHFVVSDIYINYILMLQVPYIFLPYTEKCHIFAVPYRFLYHCLSSGKALNLSKCAATSHLYAFSTFAPYSVFPLGVPWHCAHYWMTGMNSW